jgi:hypothetical protein
VAFTDDDCRPAPTWLVELADALRASPGAMVGGYTRNAICDRLGSRVSQDLIDYLYLRLNADAEDARFFTSNNLAAPVERLLELGGFSTAYRRAAGEDRELCRAWRRRGWPMLYRPAAVVDHHHAMGVRGFWRQQVNYGRGARTFAHGCADDDPPTPPGFYRGLVMHPLRCRGPLSGLPGAGLAALSQVAITCGWLAQQREDRRGAARGVGAAEASET